MDIPSFQIPGGGSTTIKARYEITHLDGLKKYCFGKIKLNIVPALLQHSYLGMEGGNALAGIIFGEVNPSGKLPYTFPKKMADLPSEKLGEFSVKDNTLHYNKGIFVGYRYFTNKKYLAQAIT